MDLARFDTQVSEEEGRFLHFEDPTTGSKIWTESDPKQAVGVVLLGAHSRKIKGLEHRLTNKRLENLRVKGGGRIKGLSSEQQEEQQREIVVAATVELRNIVFGERTFVNNEADVRELYDRLPMFQQQADEFMSDQANYLGEALKG